jgi:hypothetical protein
MEPSRSSGITQIKQVGSKLVKLRRSFPRPPPFTKAEKLRVSASRHGLPTPAEWMILDLAKPWINNEIRWFPLYV